MNRARKPARPSKAAAAGKKAPPAPRGADKAAAETEARKRELYREMVRSVRAWLAVACPNYRQDQVDITLFDAIGCGQTVANFHADAESAYCVGDRMAMDHK